ncbi:MAG: glycosyltransferase family 9 protein, partial [Planctomycetota bacterium]
AATGRLRVVDELIVIPRRAWSGWSLSRRLSELRSILERLKALAFDASLDLQGLAKSALAARLAGIPKRIGFGGREGKELSRLLNNTLVTPEEAERHVVERNLALLRPLGMNGASVRFPRPSVESRVVKIFLARERLSRQGFAVMNPGGGWPAKRWPLERFCALAQGLEKDPGLRIVVAWGNQEEKKMAEAIVQSAPLSCMMAPETDLRELWALLAQGALFVGGDTGPLHMAAAAGVPTVALFGPTSGLRNGPYGAGHRMIQGRCANHPHCWKRRHREACTCMQSIAVEEVLEACRSLGKKRGDEG